MAPSLARKLIATTWGNPSLSSVASAALWGSRRKAACSSGVSWIWLRRLMHVLLAGQRAEGDGPGGRPRTEDTRLGRGAPGGARNELAEGGAAHPSLAPPHADPRPRLDLVHVHGALADCLERLFLSNLLTSAQDRLAFGERGEPGTEAVQLVHHPPEARQMQQATARAARLARVLAGGEPADARGHREPGQMSLREGHRRAGHARAVARDEHAGHRALHVAAA